MEFGEYSRAPILRYQAGLSWNGRVGHTTEENSSGNWKILEPCAPNF